MSEVQHPAVRQQQVRINLDLSTDGELRASQELILERGGSDRHSLVAHCYYRRPASLSPVRVLTCKRVADSDDEIAGLDELVQASCLHVAVKVTLRPTGLPSGQSDGGGGLLPLRSPVDMRGAGSRPP